ncbi:MAG: c-type cytochrome [Neisseria sp.]|nr:c-type cytochrome [Neisseria sp.]
MNHSTKQNMRGSALTTLIGGVVIVLAVLFFFVKLANSGYYSDVAETTETATETRIMPQGTVVMGDGTPIGERQGEQIFNKVCIQCHAADGNVPNAPRITNNGEWAARIAQGFDTLFQHALNGFNAMPAKGGQADLTDDELKRVIVYMTNKSGANFPEPTAVAGNAAASDAAASGAASGTAAPAAADNAAVAAPAATADGKAVYDSLCMACHAAGVAGAPKTGDSAGWKDRLAQGKDTLVKNAITGFTGKTGVMPAKGGNPGLSDAEVEAAVIYMANQSGGSLK